MLDSTSPLSNVLTALLVSLVIVFFTFSVSFLLTARRTRAEKRLYELYNRTNVPVPNNGNDRAEKVSGEANQSFTVVYETSRRQQERLDAIAALGDSYHEQALGQARVQFRVSTVAASVGFLLIIYGGFIQISNAPIEATDIILSVLPGAVIEAVAALFFAQAASTRQRATDFFSRLQDDQRSRQALEIADGIEEPRLKSLVYSQMALHTAGLTTSELDIQSVLGKASVEIE